MEMRWIHTISLFGMSGIMIAYVFCAFSYATVFCEDLGINIDMRINRGNTWKYVVSRQWLFMDRL